MHILNCYHPKGRRVWGHAYIKLLVSVELVGVRNHMFNNSYLNEFIKVKWLLKETLRFTFDIHSSLSSGQDTGAKVILMYSNPRKSK